MAAKTLKKSVSLQGATPNNIQRRGSISSNVTHAKSASSSPKATVKVNR